MRRRTLDHDVEMVVRPALQRVERFSPWDSPVTSMLESQRLQRFDHEWDVGPASDDEVNIAHSPLENLASPCWSCLRR